MKSLHLSNQLTNYGLFATAFLSAGTAVSQIVYTDVDPDIVLNENGDYDIDMDDYGGRDFRLVNFISAGSFHGGLLQAHYDGNYVAGYSTSNFILIPIASVLNSGEVVGSTLDWVDDGYLFWTNLFPVVQGGLWENVYNKWAGVKFDIDGQEHFGWIRMDVTSSPIVITLKDFAYDATANTPIGIFTTDIENDNGFYPTILLSHKQLVIQLHGNLNSCSVKFYNITGQEVLSVDEVPDNNSIDLQQLEFGVYLFMVTSGEKYYSCMVAVN
ncbi:MAG: T9SS type A sorting domain-containing protein [Chitinophagales bacterium]